MRIAQAVIDDCILDFGSIAVELMAKPWPPPPPTPEDRKAQLLRDIGEAEDEIDSLQYWIAEYRKELDALEMAT